jgi:hypothetical protein
MGSFRGYLSPTLDFWPATAELTQEMRPVRRGLGDLLLQSKMAHSRIAVFYSVPSAICGQVHPGSEFVGPQATHETWTGLTYELGLDFRYLTSAMLKRGLLDPREFKVVLLPMSQAIGPEEAEAIRKFVEAGGTAIADVRPGIYDSHGKPITPGCLDDLFGIRRSGRGKAVRLPVTVKGSLEGHEVDVQFAQAWVDPDVQRAAAQPLATADAKPLVLVNRVEAGRAILLNFQVPPVAGNETEVLATAAHRLLGWLYEVAGVKAAVKIAGPNGGPLPLVETRVWQNGDAVVVGLHRRMQCEWFAPKSGTMAGEPEAATITLPEPRHAYDLRAGKYLGSVKKIDLRLRWGRANFYLITPHEVNSPQVSLSDAAPGPGQTITASIRIDLATGVSDRHAVWVEITDPQGQQPLWGQHVVVLDRGVGQVQIPIAYNDQAGRWRIKATELFSNRSGEASWDIR